MEELEMREYRRRLAGFFYPFLANVELGNISAEEGIRSLIDAFMSYNEISYFQPPPHADSDEKASTKEADEVTKENESCLLEASKAIGRIYHLE